MNAKEYNARWDEITNDLRAALECSESGDTLGAAHWTRTACDKIGMIERDAK
jgi:hypothetical protein